MEEDRAKVEKERDPKRPWEVSNCRPQQENPQESSGITSHCTKDTTLLYGQCAYSIFLRYFRDGELESEEAKPGLGGKGKKRQPVPPSARILLVRIPL